MEYYTEMLEEQTTTTYNYMGEFYRQNDRSKKPDTKNTTGCIIPLIWSSRTEKLIYSNRHQCGNYLG